MNPSVPNATRPSVLRSGPAIRPEPHEDTLRTAMTQTLGHSLLYVSRDGSALIFKLRGGLIRDQGDEILAESGTDAEIRAMVALVTLRGWPDVLPRGSADFVRRLRSEFANRHREDDERLDPETRAVASWLRELMGG